MAVYAILRKPGAPADRTIFLREGFSVPAFLFTVAWALWNRLWLVAALIFAAMAALALLGSLTAANELAVATVNFGLSLILGFEAQALHQAALRRAGYVADGLVEAADLEEAELKYFAEALPARPTTPAQSGPFAGTGQGDPLGLFGNV